VTGWLTRLLLLLTVLALGCGKQEVIVKTADGRSLGAEEVDRDPMALLPGGAVGLGYLNMQELYASELGQKLRTLIPKFVPLPPAANFDPARDLRVAYLGVYVAQGIDAVAAVSGTFDQAAIERATDQTQPTPLGVPLVKSTYAGRTLYTARNVGFTVLTAHTALFGNETGMRRALDRINDARVAREVPGWAIDLLERPTAPLAGAIDLKTNPLSAAALGSAPFLAGLERVRVVGNFQPPGVNLAGTAVYADGAQAAQGAQSLTQINSYLSSWSFFAALLGIPQPVRQLDCKPNGPILEFVMGLDAQAVAALLDQLGTVASTVAASAPGTK
jgi:hypothetical protein